MSISRYKLFTLIVCPATLLLGHLCPTRFPDDLQYRINKDGLLNSFFVKRGWFWTSAIGWWCMIRYRSFNRQNHHSLVRVCNSNHLVVYVHSESVVRQCTYHGSHLHPYRWKL